MYNLEVNEEFKKLIPPLSKEEYEQLETNCLNEGIREAILTWNGVIIDGHNRYEIAKRWNLDFQTKSKNFKDEIDVRIWMRNNQKGRRNLSKAWLIELELGNKQDLSLRGEIIFKEKAVFKGNQYSAPLSQNDNEPKHNTQKEIAKAAGVSTGMIAMSEIVKEKSPELWEKAKEGEITVTSAYKEIKKEEKKVELQEKRQKIEEGVFNVDVNNIPEKFDVIYADPPWKYDFAETDNRKIENHYITMDNSDIAKMNVPAADNCVLFMWATAPKLIEAIEVLKGWGFEYKTCAVWDKEKVGMGYWFRGQHELLMVGVKGNVSPPEASIRISSVIRESRQRHSRKPDCIAEYIELAFYDKSKIELFCREPRNGWYSFGNQIETHE
jgi:N6-adenosine-specific RNA methylase IME4